MDFALGGFSIGRFFGIRVVISWLFVLYAGFEILHSDGDPLGTAFFLFILFGTVLLHEFGHCFACRSVKGQVDHIVLWPLGGLAFVRPPARPGPALWTTLGGPLVNVVLIPLAWLVAFVLVPALQKNGAGEGVIHAAWLVGFRGLFINAILLFFNLLPIYPLDGGRILQEILWFFIGYPKSLHVAGMIGTAGGLSLVAMGLGVTSITPHLYVPGLGNFAYHLSVQGEQDWMLLTIGLWSAMQSFAVYRQSQQMEIWRKR